MAGTTANQVLPYPTSSDAPDGPAQILALAQAVERRLVMQFASVADRNTRVPAPVEGMVSFLQDVDRYDFYLGTAWVPLGQGLGGRMAPPVVSTATLATFTNVEVKETTLGNYTFTARAGRIYRFVMNVRAAVSVAGTSFDLRIRDGGAAAPSGASPVVATWSVSIATAGGPGTTSVSVSMTNSSLTAGTHIVALYGIRTAGTGTVALDIAGGGQKELYVEDVGSAT